MSLPSWRGIRRSIDPGLVLVVALTAFALIPLLRNAGLPNGPDVLYHSYRVAEMNRSWSHGLLFPTWAEGFYLGYGSPLFHFYARLTYVTTSLFHVVLGLDALDALRALLALSLLGCSSGMYLFAKRRFGRLSGIIAGLLYVYSPYLMYTEAYARGTYPELLSFALFPWLLWRVDALRDKVSPVNFLSLVLLQAALINAHNLMALVLTGMTLAWIAFEAALQYLNREASRLGWRPAAWALLAMALGAGAAATFWLPVLLESDSVHLQNLTVAGLLDYREAFVRLPDLLAPPPIHDAGAINGLSELKILGLAQWMQALLALAATAALYIRGYRSLHPQSFLGVLYFAIIALAMLLLVLPGALPFWDSFRPIQFLQFPWRLLGPIAACLAIIGGANGLWLARLDSRPQISLSASLVALPILLAIPLFYVPEWRHETLDTSIAAYHAEETARRQLGTTFTGEYRPRHVHSVPDPTAHLLLDYADGYPIDKLNHSILPEGSAAELIHNSPQAHEWRIRSGKDFVAEIYNFYWLGWRAEIDGRPVEITPSPHHGFITFPVPSGEHKARLYLGSTPARDLAAWASLLSILLSVGAAALLRRRTAMPRPYWNIAPLSRPATVGALLGGGIALLCVLVFFQEGLAWHNSPPGEALPAQFRTRFTLDDSLQVLGYDLSADVLRPGDHLRLRVYWYALEEIDVNFSSFLHLSTGGPPQAQVDKLHPAGRAISEWWGPDGYIVDTYDLRLPEQLSVGEYQLIVGLYTCELMPADDCGNGYRPRVTDETGDDVGDSVPLTSIRVAAG
ncbi:MAG: 6-pyruvoyl-tetrahydropterin synthase-related protein [Chloroflexota bacterium]|nr:6-pyruvoyl-tetrahydropterin synthase-related protein [Chloroflexota bacterium]